MSCTADPLHHFSWLCQQKASLLTESLFFVKLKSLDSILLSSLTFHSSPNNSSRWKLKPLAKQFHYVAMEFKEAQPSTEQTRKHCNPTGSTNIRVLHKSAPTDSFMCFFRAFLKTEITNPNQVPKTWTFASFASKCNRLAYSHPYVRSCWTEKGAAN